MSRVARIPVTVAKGVDVQLTADRITVKYRNDGYILSRAIVPAQRISEIVSGKRAITADTDLRLCRFFGLSNGYWLRAQAAHDTEVAEVTLAKTLKKIRPWSQSQTQASMEHTA